MTSFFLSLALSAVFEPSVMSDEYYSENFSAIALFDDGSYAQVQLTMTNAGPGDNKGACRVLVVRKGGKTWRNGNSYGKKEWGYNHKKDRLEVGPCHASFSRDGTVIYGRVENTAIHLKFDKIPSPTKPPRHRIKVDDDFYEHEVIVPYSDVVATLSARERLTGRGYIDHSRSNTLPKPLAKRWVRYRNFDPTCGIISTIRVPPKGKPHGWIWSAKETSPRALTKVKVGAPSVRGDKVIKNTSVSSEQWTTILSTDEKLVHYAPAKEHGLLGRLVGGVIGSPETGVFLVKDKGCDSVGVLEVTDL